MMWFVIGIILLAATVAVIAMAARNRNAASSLYGMAPRAMRGNDSVEPSPLQDALDRWVAAKLINSRQANALLRYEIERSESRRSRLPLAAEAVGYIGASLVIAAGALLVGNQWDAMSSVWRITSLAAPTIVTGVAGWWMGRIGEPALQRLGSVLWLLTVIGVAGLAGEVWVDIIHDGDPPDHHAALFIGSTALLAAAPAWWSRRVGLQQLALLGATITFSLGVIDTLAASRDRSMSVVAAGLVLVALGMIWLGAGVTARLPPALLANLSGSTLILVGAQVVRADNDHAGLWLGLVASITLMVTGVARSELEVLFVGTAGLFQWTPQIALFYLGDTLGTEATLFVIGTVLIVLAGLVTRIYPRLDAAGRNATPRRDDGSIAPEGSPVPPSRGARYGLIFGGSIVALVLMALGSQWLESIESDRRGPLQDDHGPPQDEEWTIVLNDGGEGIHSVVMIKTFSPLEESDIDGLGGHLRWEQTEIVLCNIGIRSVGDGFVQIGDIFATAEGCGSDTGMQRVFDLFGTPEIACVFVRANGVFDEYCAPLTVG